ncbi:hypothetical protein FBUS_01906 [Fasciolopsis buskii]|uniref:EF-hand domain-containing protein n=1 Tax=Fasciolopsis buskii TaxID=27845 RepID=A0A8E0RS85_9TREM|nr:hypothetical protein FBUS_01906 [Fasciolopsis buski]
MTGTQEIQNHLRPLDHHGDGKVTAEELKAFAEKSNCPLDAAKIKAFIEKHHKGNEKLDLKELATFLSA